MAGDSLCISGAQRQKLRNLLRRARETSGGIWHRNRDLRALAKTIGQQNPDFVGAAQARACCAFVQRDHSDMRVWNAKPGAAVLAGPSRGSMAMLAVFTVMPYEL